MFSPTEQRTKPRTLNKKSLPFKAPSPLLKRNNQKPLNFFLSKSKSSLGEIEKKRPLEFKSESQLNRTPSHVPLINLAKSKSTLAQMTTHTNSFKEDELVDLTQEDEPEPEPKNFKTSAAPGSLMTRPTREGRVTTLYTQSMTTSSVPSSSSPSSSLPSSFSSSSTTTSSSSSGAKISFTQSTGGQALLSLGSKKLQPNSAKRTNPWSGSQPLGKKNPRLVKTGPRTSSSYSNQSLASITLSPEQQHVLRLIESGKNVFYTGSAGTGKSVLLREIVKRLRHKFNDTAVAVTASTGLAAVNVGGQTINRFSCMGIGDQTVAAYVNKIKKIAEVRETWRRTKVLIIDEISMLDGKFLDKLEAVARGVRGNPNPFGGIQVILTGDFFQLPPVPDRRGPTLFGFESDCWKSIHHTILLHQVFRQADPEFVDILNSVRMANITDEAAAKLSALKREVKYDDNIMPTELYATRQEVESSNRRRLNHLPGEPVVFEAQDNDENPREKNLVDNVMALKTLTLKEDAQVMMLKNIDATLVNGTVGVVLAFLSFPVFLVLKRTFTDKELCSDEGIKWMRIISGFYKLSDVPDYLNRELNKETEERKKTIAEVASLAVREPAETERLPVIRFTTQTGPRVELTDRVDFVAGVKESDNNLHLARKQLPLLLSWALSIHKSQGQTLDRVCVDLNRVFEAGHVYVSLSRAVSKDRLQILNFSKGKIRANDKVKRFYEGLERY